MQIGEPFVEIGRVVGGTIVPLLKATGKVELQANLKAESDIAEAQRRRPGVDHEHRHGEQLTLDPVDAGRVNRTCRYDELESSTSSHRGSAVANDDTLRPVARTKIEGAGLLPRNSPPDQRKPCA